MMSDKDMKDPSSTPCVQDICSVNTNQKVAINAGKENSCQNPLKMKINPLDLLICLKKLLNANGAIKSIDEVQRVAGLMGKYSKKLVSKCIYLNILQATEQPLLDEFYKDTGWNLICAWLTESVATRNYPLAQQILSLLLVSPISIERLKRNNIPKMVKDLSKDCPHASARKSADEVVQRWKELVKGCTIENNSLMDTHLPDLTLQSETLSSSLVTLRVNSSDTSQEGSDAHTISGAQPLPPNDVKTESCPQADELKQLQNSSSVASEYATFIDRKGKKGLKRSPLKRGARGVGRGGRGRRKKIVGRGRGRALSYAELLSQDFDSDENNSDSHGKPSFRKDDDSRASVPPIRIKISNVAVQQSKVIKEFSEGRVLSVDSTEKKLSVDSTEKKLSVDSTEKKLLVDSTDSDDDRPLSEIKHERQKAESGSLEEKRKEHSDDEEVRTKKKRKQRIIDEDDTDEESKREEIQKPELEKKGDASDIKEKERKRTIEANDVKDKDKLQFDNVKEKENHTKSKETIKMDDNDTPTKGRDGTQGKEISENKKSKENEKEQKNKRKESSHGENRPHKKDREKKHRNEREREKEREKKRERKSSEDKLKEREKIGRRTSDDKGRDRQKEQERKDKATLDKVKPLSTEGLARIPRRAATFMDALGSADTAGVRSQNTTVKHKSRGSRHSETVDVSKSLHSTARKHSTDTHSTKRPTLTEGRKKEKDTAALASSATEVFGGSKLTSPKRTHLSDDGGFMAALTAAGADRKKVSRKRKSSESDLKQEVGTSVKSSKSESSVTDSEHFKKDNSVMPSKSYQEEIELKSNEKCEGDAEVLSPTTIKPTLNFYKETLNVKEEGNSNEGSAEAKSCSTVDASNDATETTCSSKTNGNDSGDEHCSDANKDEDNMEIEELDDTGKDLDGDVQSHGDEEGISSAPVPAPANEEYEKIEVTFATPLEQLKSAIVYHRPQNRVKKGVSWRPEAELKETFLFPMDETERVNVNTIKFNEMMLMEKANEKELMFGKHRGRLPASAVEMRMANNCLEFGPYKLYPVHLPNPPSVTPGYKSVEKHVQAQREHATMATFFHPAMLPDTPAEPNPEMVQRVEPMLIPLIDVIASDCVSDNRGIPWPEPLFNPPEIPYGGGSSVGPPCPPQQTGGHWVLGNHSVPRVPLGCGTPLFAGPNGPQGPGGNHGNFGHPPPPPQGYPGGSWGGPGEFGGPPVIMANGPPHMNMHNIMGPNPGIHGGPPMQGGPGPGHSGPRPNIGMVSGPPPPIGNRDSYNHRYRRGRGGGSSWSGGPQGPRGYCKHFRNGHCRHGDDCMFLHVPS